MTTSIPTTGTTASLAASRAKLTPMMRQYLSVKEEHPGAIVLFRMGDFFETFFEDAVECARLLDITLTARSKEKDIPMAGVPHHAIDGYLQRLIEHGRTVVLVDQVEDPRQAKGLVRREVTRVLSPGTYVDPEEGTRTSRYLCALCWARPKARASRARKASADWGLAALDVSTGEFKATEGVEHDVLVDELGRLGACELLVDTAGETDPRLQAVRKAFPSLVITPREEGSDRGESGLPTLVRHFGAAEVAGFKTALGLLPLRAADCALGYVSDSWLLPEAPDRRGAPSLKHVERLAAYAPGDALALDAAAREHLELFRGRGSDSSGSFLSSIDDTASAPGARLLRRWLAYPRKRHEPIRERQRAVAAFVGSPSALDDLRQAFREVADLERLLGRIVMGRANPRDLASLRASIGASAPILAAAESVSRPASSPIGDGEAGGLPASDPQPMRSERLAALARVDRLPDVQAWLREALVESPAIELTGPQPVFREGYDELLDRAVEVARDGKHLIAELEAKEKQRTQIPSLKVRYNKVFGYYIEVTKANLHLVPETYVRKQTTVNAERYFTEELKALETEVLSAEDRRAERAQALFVALVERVGAESARISALAHALAELDVLATFAVLAERRDWVCPVVDDSLEIDIKEGRHPVIERCAEELEERFVPNDLLMGDSERLMIVTGPNMAGKSTIMRQTALIAILAHMGSFVPARSARLGLVDRIFTRVGAADDLSRGRSTFMVEMNETARILRSATDRSLVLLDEIGRGTSTFDGLSIAWAVAEHLHDRVGCRTLFATHYHELTELCRDKARAVNRHVAVKEWNDEIVFLRKLMSGPTNKSYGVQVARLAGLPAPVLTRAREVLDSLEAQALSAGNSSAVVHLVEARARAARDGPGQLFLFSPAEPPAPTARADPAETEVLERLRALDVDDLSPRQALALLDELKRSLS